MEDCLFCRIITGEIPSNKVYEDEFVYAFTDIDPKAPVHILIIPKKHLKSILEVKDGDFEYIDAMIKAAQKIAAEKGIAADGFRLVFNTGENGGQTVPHLHLHLLGGRYLEWPPG
ncbi:histidine triad nucleotide-binding protein [Christensenella tenuis]|jgi:histidine triad (HIT) family protein|uniref:Histidine triad nucleotide-binding protein n=1 Tax=Christensenella tenuis TaxID=2763033 RepID=A0ABR7EC42_9FIRM|nr:histidine triad nucleotide-binding protein [Christensenella tenuis]MBC5647343.1 histidine triad nucleotide-binding protein [Christensenella tenuis]